MDVFSATSASLFATSTDQQVQMENLAQRQLANALDLFTQNKYDEAIATFKRAIGLAPLSSTATNAYDYLAKSYLAKGDAGAAIAAYQESLRANPTNADAYASLGQIYVSQNDLTKARDAYVQAVRLDPSSANLYSLGQTYLEMGQYADAERQFKSVKEKEPAKPNGDYGLGQVYAKQGRTNDAINAFQRAIGIQQDFWYAHAELGYALTDAGERDKAKEIVNTLQTKAPDLASTLSQYISAKTPAKMIAVFPDSTFQRSLGPRTSLASLSSYLDNPGDQQTFSMIFAFNKAMDPQSVENVLNWSIGRAYDFSHGSIYNYGMPVPSTEVSLDPHPVSVSYNADDQTATMLFRVSQNATGDGTIDPSHIKFSFSGTDDAGMKISDQADEYTSISGFA
jgi:tetratricopeptide (TPR) repeat protein